jgi:hypothetical protein
VEAVKKKNAGCGWMDGYKDENENERKDCEKNETNVEQTNPKGLIEIWASQSQIQMGGTC